MKIGLHKADKTNFPSLPLMKLSSYYKEKNYTVEKYLPIAHDGYDKIFSSKVFTFSDNKDYLPNDAILGGTGYGKFENLPDEVEHIMPDYSLYKCNKSYGFVTRGCSNKCAWCIVPQKEGKTYFNAHIQEFLQHKELVLLDNNILSLDKGVDELTRISKLNIKIDINQGLDTRLVDKNIASILTKINFSRYIRFACDSQSQIEALKKAISLLRSFGYKKEIFCYCLLVEEEESLNRIEELRHLGVKPFAQPYRDFQNNINPKPVLKKIARWCNHKAIFNKVKWKDYLIHYEKNTLEETLFI